MLHMNRRIKIFLAGMLGVATVGAEVRDGWMLKAVARPDGQTQCTAWNESFIVVNGFGSTFANGHILTPNLACVRGTCIFMRLGSIFANRSWHRDFLGTTQIATEPPALVDGPDGISRISTANTRTRPEGTFRDYSYEFTVGTDDYDASEVGFRVWEGRSPVRSGQTRAANQTTPYLWVSLPRAQFTNPMNHVYTDWWLSLGRDENNLVTFAFWIQEGETQAMMQVEVDFRGLKNAYDTLSSLCE